VEVESTRSNLGKRGPSWRARNPKLMETPFVGNVRKLPFRKAIFRASPFVKNFGESIFWTKKTSPNVTVPWLDTSKKGLEAWLHPLTTHGQAYVAGTKMSQQRTQFKDFCEYAPIVQKHGNHKKKSCLKSSRWSQNKILLWDSCHLTSCFVFWRFPCFGEAEWPKKQRLQGTQQSHNRCTKPRFQARSCF